MWWVLLRIMLLGSLLDGVSDNSRRKDTFHAIAKYVRKGERLMEIVMVKDKTTPGAVRYNDGENHNIYLRKEEAAAMGNPESVKVTIEAS